MGKRHSRRRPCNPSLLALSSASSSFVGHNTSRIYADGFSRFGCEVDIAPESERTHFKPHVCGGVPSCRAITLPMEPRLCFDFCRTVPTAHFFGIVHGIDCYCATYFTSKSTGGQGECTDHCEGNTKEMCGGPTKSSLFEMHMCGDSVNEADIALQQASEQVAINSELVQAGGAVVAGLRGLAKAWVPGACSIEPEGKRVCALPDLWLENAAAIEEEVAKTDYEADVVTEKMFALSGFKNETAGIPYEELNASLMSDMELTTDALSDAASKARGAATVANITLSSVKGPIGGAGLSASAFNDTFQALGDVANGWNGLCALVPMPGQAFAAMAQDSPAACAEKCLGESVGMGGCVGFNYQYYEGLAACQLLTSEGLTEPLLLKAVPIFEVSDSKKASMGITSIACYVHGAFVAGHPQGPLGTEVIRELTA